MLDDWDAGLIGNNPGKVSSLPRRETFAQVLVRAFAEVQARRAETPFRRAA